MRKIPYQSAHRSGTPRSTASRFGAPVLAEGDPFRGPIALDERAALRALTLSFIFPRRQTGEAFRKEKTMGFNNQGPVTAIRPNVTLFWTYSFGGDRGLQIAGPDLKTRNAELDANNQGKFIDLRGFVIYSLTIKNVTSVSADHNLQGGGAS